MPRITQMYAFIAENSGPDDEGVIGVRTKDGGWLPLVGADMDRIEALKPLALMAMAGKKMKLVKFVNRVDIEEFNV